MIVVQYSSVPLCGGTPYMLTVISSNHCEIFEQIIYRVIQEEKSVFWEVIVLVIVRKKLI